ncbi:MAG: hypothetical protein H0U40_12310 [Chloroflexia bacterium]|nr:hypothetical protein [Chloroflexia bacterium]
MRDWLVERGIPFVERNVTGDLDAAMALYRTGTFATPLLVVGETRVLGFRPAEIEAAAPPRAVESRTKAPGGAQRPSSSSIEVPGAPAARSAPCQPMPADASAVVETQAPAAQALLQHVPHPLGAGEEGVHLVDLPTGQCTPAIRCRGILRKIVEEPPRLGDGESGLPRHADHGQADQHVRAVPAATVQAARRGQETHALVVADRRWPDTRPASHLADAQGVHVSEPLDVERA